ncbi:uncharacterized protein LOC125238706 isoform X2 [Leguminivora glycinivorella]|uniref:uncharacterized protein LOC125238706 isoform X2 n=1 Tax=Leguminivora glycinivorella TaxID=1035111 RepID=UPI00201048A8|nr:uncharacterized protein LOC125238706 isoform X2 [Leguminivora glycinivorella]
MCRLYFYIFLMCVMACLLESIAGASKSSCSSSRPVYNKDGVAVSKIDFQSSYKPISVKNTETDIQKTYKPLSVRVEKEYQPSSIRVEKEYQPSSIRVEKEYQPTSIRVEKEYQPSYKSVYGSTEKESRKSNSKPSYVSVSERDYQSPVPIISYDEDIYNRAVDVPNNGGAFIVNSVSNIAPYGLGVATDVNLAGELEVSGVVPYLSAVTFEGQFDANGAAAVEYGCGDCVAVTEEIRGNPGLNKFGGGKY